MDSATHESSHEAGPTHEEVPGHRLIERIKELVADGNAKAVRVRTDDGTIFLEIPLTPAAITGGVVARRRRGLRCWQQSQRWSVGSGWRSYRM